MKKRDHGVYVKARFEIDPACIAELVKRYKLVEEVFRVQILAVSEKLEHKLANERAARQARIASQQAKLDPQVAQPAESVTEA